MGIHRAPETLAVKDIPSEVTLDSELAKAIARVGLYSRTSASAVDANTTFPVGQCFALRWIDQNTLSNFPAGVNFGTLVQFDALLDAVSSTDGTSIENKYRFQLFLVPSLPTPKMYYRGQSNGTWSSWVLA